MYVQSKSDALNAGIIQAGLQTEGLGRTLHILTETPSTNTLGVTLANSGEPHGTVILAEHQTAGKGRLGRSWISPPNKNIFCSIILKDPRLQPYVTWIPLATGLAISEAIQSVQSIGSSLKWPNDLLINNKKLCGILCEGTSGTQTSGTWIVGFGINVNSTKDDFPPELQPTLTSLALETQEFWNRNTLLAFIFNILEKWYDQLASGNIDAIQAAYTTACSTVGIDVRCTLTGTQEIHGRAIAIGKDGSLQIIPFTEGAKKAIEVRSADVTHLR